MLELTLFSVALVILIVSVISDVRTKEVPDWVNFSGIIMGLSVRSIWSLNTGDWSVLGYGVLGFVFFFAIAVIMFYSGQWGGGDSKLLMAMGALIGFEFSAGSIGVTFLLWSLLAGAVYGVVCSAWLAARNGKAFVTQYKKLSKGFSKLHWPMLVVFLLGLGFGIATDDELLRVASLSIGLIAPVLFYSGMGMKAVELCCMLKAKKPAELVEGDWVAVAVRVKGKLVCSPKGTGITKQQINLLKKLKVKKVTIKEGIAFTPTFLIGFLLALWLGNPFQWMF